MHTLRGAIVCTLGFILALAGSPARAQTSDGGKVYSGDEGVEVRVVFLHPRSDGNALVEVNGSASEIDGKARLHQFSESGSRVEYRGKLHGRDFYTLTARDGRYTLYVPGSSRELAVKYDDAKSKALDAAALIGRYHLQQKDGSLAALERFDRPARMARAEATLKKTAGETAKACGGAIAAGVDWSSISDETLGELSIPSYCGAPLETMAKLCKSSPVARGELGTVSAFDCKLGAGIELKRDGARLHWTVDKGASNLDDRVTEALLGPAPGDGPPWGKRETLGQRIALEAATVCGDNKSHYVVLADGAGGRSQLYYGDGKRFTLVPGLEYLSGSEFFDPRNVNPTANSNFRGHDMRVISSVEASRADGKCAARCGTRSIPLAIVPAATATPMLSGAQFAPAVEQHLPHALLRDEHGNYYYVDKGSSPAGAHKFRLFKGPKGALKEQKMTNVVADSEGEIFSTRSGSLRMIIDRNKPSLWIANGKSASLRAVPVDDNLPLIYNDLGVYAGERMGTPCDDL